jgi:hypothetical protein
MASQTGPLVCRDRLGGEGKLYASDLARVPSTTRDRIIR